MYPLDDTIAAIASAPGGAARGIIRISGPHCLQSLRSVFSAEDSQELQTPRYPKVIGGSLYLQGINASLPCDLYLWPVGRSYTGQMVAECHTLGSPPLLDAILKSLCGNGTRIAEPGEFTLRAFLSGRIDLTQAEAVLGVIDAADPRELKVAVAQLAGGLAGPLHKLRDMLLELLAHLEAGFDFADEDLAFITPEELQIQLDRAVDIIDRLAKQMESRGAAQTAVRAVLLGQPNTGKSSLFNALIEKEHALVSDMPGTTRDYLIAELDFDGRKCQLIDTAGIHEETANASDISKHPDRAAQQAAVEQIERANIRLLCLDATRPLDVWEQDELARSKDTVQIVVLTKQDAIQRMEDLAINHPVIGTSSVTGEGLELLRAELERLVHRVETSIGDVVASTAVRCHQSLHRASESMQNARTISEANGGEEFIAADIRQALEELGKVVGTVYTDDVLDRLFSRFCVGK